MAKWFKERGTMKKLFYIVLDGLGDTPIKELEDRTPLEYAQTPNIDKLAKEGATGFMYTVGKGIAPESDIAVISILGYDAHKVYTGRGPLESYAEGLEVNDGNLAYRVNFATLGENNQIIDRRVKRSLSTEEANQLCEEINSKVKLTSYPADFEFKNTIGHRGVLVIRLKNGRLSSLVTNTDPAYDKKGVFGVAKEKFENVLLKCKPIEGKENLEETEKAAELTNEFIKKSHEVMQNSEINKKRVKEGKLPANIIITRDGGDKLPEFVPLREKFGLDFGCFVEMPVEKGIALLTGMSVIKLPLSTDNVKEDYEHRAQKAVNNIKKFDALYIHIKGPDEPAHDGNVEGKIKSIEAIDNFFFDSLLSNIDLNNFIIAVTADHSTPCNLKAHSDDPVPLLVNGSGVESDDVEKFSERECQKGSIGEIEGNQLMPRLAELVKK